MRREIKVEYIPYNSINETLSFTPVLAEHLQSDTLYNEKLIKVQIRDEILKYTGEDYE